MIRIFLGIASLFRIGTPSVHYGVQFLYICPHIAGCFESTMANEYVRKEAYI